ncbi:MAG: hypothetical protein L6V93_14200 [Clostridiales bacterium]|nr:MAG: hypothetical protein L6V93_14200 [Clostridiales bacterium]
MTLALIFSSFAVMNSFAVSFSDLEGHWGKSYIDVLVNDGTNQRLRRRHFPPRRHRYARRIC